MNTKSKLLELLEAGRGKSLSGESIASALGITRAAVWKAVVALKRDGYNVSGVQNRGYTLTDGNNILSAEAIYPHLLIPSVKERIRVFPSLASTNKTAKELSANGDETSVIVADTQTDGHGRLGRPFYSPPGTGLYISFILSPSALELPLVNSVTIYAAGAVCRAIKTVCGVECGIKWVNDVFFNGKKICGILTEAVSDLETGSIERIILGIGINISTANFPDNINSVAGAIYSAPETLSAPIDVGAVRNRLAAELINIFCGAYPEFTFNAALDLYRERMLLLGKTVIISKAGTEFTAEVRGIDKIGRLVVLKPDGSTENLSSGEIIIR
ncbi:MAG: biotin--[acetyl-CoA-carboxylase] ligase [Clostridiaceae bacterium]|nr:biotin--[acetyl-CoA-carboxylase] ligase [Clostridiaceae bacterium]